MTTLGAQAEILSVPSLVARRRPRRTVAGLALALLAPTLISLLVFTYWPLGVSAVGSLERWSRTGAAPRFVGLDNYRELWRDALFRQVLVNTAAYVLVEGPLAVLLGLACAMAVDGHRRLRLVARALVLANHQDHCCGARRLVWLG